MKHIGIDIGSTTVKAVVTDAQGIVVHQSYERHHAQAREALRSCLDHMLPACGTDETTITVTGSVGMGIAERYGLPFVQEVVAASNVVKRQYPQVATLIDIGGEDAKVVFFNNGEAQDLRMNGNCAGGTGAFIDQMAIILGVDTAEMNRLALRAKHLHPIASRCGVFCKTDIQNLIARNVSREDIAASIFHAVAVQTVITLAHGCDIRSPLLCCGGPLTFIPALRKAFANYLAFSDADIVLPEHGELIPALGAAWDNAHGKPTVSLPALIQEIDKTHAETIHAATTLQPLFTDNEAYRQWRTSHARRQLPKAAMGKGKQYAYLGIDSGSTTTKIVAIDEDRRLLYSYYRNNGGNPIQAVKDGLADLARQCAENGVELYVRGSCSTGYGEDLIKASFGLHHGIVETMAHYMAARHTDRDVSFVLDIGGQDMKAIFINRGIIDRIEINEACSSGCGSFIETFAGSLGQHIDDFARRACVSQAPCDLGTRCTVFMNSKVKQAIREGATVDDIAAGLAYSVVKNCLYKVLKLKDTSDLGRHIVVQGGTMRNDAVVRALELLTGCEVSRCDCPEQMGAFGCALYAMDHRQGQAIPLTDLLEQSKCSVRQHHCHGCENQCVVQHYHFANGHTYYSGNRCEKVFSNASDRRQKGQNVYAVKNKLLFGNAHLPIPKTHAATAAQAAWTIGIPRVLNMYEEYPFWQALFTTCGIRTLLSDESSFAAYERNARMVMSDNICFPAKLVHSHIANLQSRGVDRIFMPFVLFEQHAENEQNSYNCPIVSGYSAVVKSVDTAGIPIDSPPVTFKDHKLLKKQCQSYLGTLGIDSAKAAAAVDRAIVIQRQYNEAIAEANRQTLDEARKRGETCILLAGRPYHSDMLIQHKVSDMLADMGIHVISEDIVRGMDIDTADAHQLAQWAFPNRIMKAAKWCSMQGADIQFVQLTSFGCGPDAFLLDAEREMLARNGKTLTLLKLDDINNIGSMRLRVRSLIESLRLSGRNRAQGRATPFETTPPFTSQYKHRKILIPYFTSFISPLLPSIVRTAGYDAVNLPLSDESAREWGLRFSNNEICYPATLIVGDIINAFRNGTFSPSESVIAITQTGGQCRASNYLPLIQKALTDAGYNDVPVISLTFGQDLGNSQPAFKVDWMKLMPTAIRAILYSDSIAKLYYAAVVREKTQGAAQQLRDRFLELGSKLIEEGRSKELFRCLRQAAGLFNKICETRACPQVGIVGEIYLKFNPFAQRNLTDWLLQRGIEVIPPTLTDFFMQSFVNRKVDIASRMARKKVSDLFLNTVYQRVNRLIEQADQAASAFRYYHPSKDIYTLARQAEKAITLNAQFGEGWLLPADVMSLWDRGVTHVISLQPFGCIANHIVSKGIERKLKSLLPGLNLLSLDFDSGVSDLNVQNRLILFIDNLKRAEHAERI